MSPLTLRRWHSYVALFVAPSVLFFALTGAVQLFNWHEAHGTYHPPVLLERLSSLHKDQVLKRHEDGWKSEDAGAAGGAEAGGPPPHEEDAVPPVIFALKIFFFLIASGLTLTTCFGVWMGVTQTGRKGLCVTLFVLGAVLPIILVASS